jgi:hypothetical protein
LLESEKSMFPHGQDEDSDAREGPDVGEEQVAWLPQKAEQQDAKQPSVSARRLSIALTSSMRVTGSRGSHW